MQSYFVDNAIIKKLFGLWQDYLSQDIISNDRLPKLDIWLKHNSTPAFSSAIISALRFTQLASALEWAYNNKSKQIDWMQWDLEWRLADVTKIPLAYYWYWLELKIHGVGFASVEKLQQYRLVDFQERNQFFIEFSQSVNNSKEQTLWLLWNGLRPQWLPLLLKRAEVNHWSEKRVKEFIALQNIPPPLWLRLKPNQDKDSVAASLITEGVYIGKTEEGYIYASGGKNITATQVYRNGLVEIQDIASQLIAKAVAAKPSEKVWDACTGAGGKSLAIASLMNNKGAIVATDLYEYKLHELKKRSQRAGIYNIRRFVWDGQAPLKLPKEIAQQQGFDWVLVDAPCTASGTWRRNPDARWNFNEKNTQELVNLQRQLLTHTSNAVRDQGYLVYATCSWQLVENEEQIAWFLSHFSDFILVSQSLLGAPELNSDTMFVAVMKKINPTSL
jgi:16S rRNA (cytosine967-C5)-methyltransferase